MLDPAEEIISELQDRSEEINQDIEAQTTKMEMHPQQNRGGASVYQNDTDKNFLPVLFVIDKRWKKKQIPINIRNGEVCDTHTGKKC